MTAIPVRTIRIQILITLLNLNQLCKRAGGRSGRNIAAEAFGESATDGLPIEADPEGMSRHRGLHPQQHLVMARHGLRRVVGPLGSRRQPSAWEEAVEAMGEADAAVTIAAILQRSAEIKSPGGYLRGLTSKARAGNFSIGPLVMALLRRRSAKPEQTSSSA
jgi:hypothetical protein